jgi:hypothetical protein
MKLLVKVSLVFLIVLAFMVAGIAGAAFDTKNLLLYWNCNDGSGTTVKYTSGMGYNGTINGKDAKWVNGKYSGGIELTNKAYVEVVGPIVAGIKGQISFGCWINVKKATTYNGIISINDGDPKDCCDYRLMIDPAKSPFWDAGLHQDRNLDGKYTFALDTWTHYVLTLDGKAGMVYINGKLVGQQADAYTPPAFPKVSFWLGLGEAVGTWPVEDSIFDDVFVANKTLTADEVTTIMNGNFLSGATAVGSHDKLSTTWADLKSK